MEENIFIPEPQPKKLRPQFLTVLCILTFISTGISLLGALIIPVIADAVLSIIKTAPGMDAQTSADAAIVLTAGWAYYMTVFLVTLLALIGAVMMWNLKKNGFHFYTIANIILFCLPIMWLGMPFNIGAAFFPAMFIGFYAMHLKYME